MLIQQSFNKILLTGSIQNVVSKEGVILDIDCWLSYTIGMISVRYKTVLTLTVLSRKDNVTVRIFLLKRACSYQIKFLLKCACSNQVKTVYNFLYINF